MGNSSYGQVVTTVVALLLAIIIGVMVYWSFVGGVSDMGSSISKNGITTDTSGNTFTAYTTGAGSNYTGEKFYVDNPIYSISNITFWNGATTLSYSETKGTSAGNYNFDGKEVTIFADTTGATVQNYTSINITYVSQTGHAVSGTGGVNDMSKTIFALLPIIAIVVVAGIILAILVGFGGSKRT